MIVTHHSSLLSINSHILLIEGEVQLVVRRVASLKAALARIQAALMQPYDKLTVAVQQLHTVQNTSEYIRQAIRVLNFCEKLRALTTTTTPTPSSSANTSSTVTSTTATTTRAPPPPLRGLVKSSALLYEVHEVFDLINLNGITCIDEQLPFLNQVSELLHNQGRKSLYDAMRTDQSTPGQVNQVDLDYALQLFYNLAPTPNAANILKAIEASDTIDTLDSSVLTGGIELSTVLDELLASYIEQLRASLRKMLDVASSSATTSGASEKKGGLLSKKSAPSATTPNSSSSSSSSSLRSTLWDRLESFTDLFSSLCIQVWTISRLLSEKKDLVWNVSPGVSFQDIWRVQKVVAYQVANAAKPAAAAHASSPHHALPVSLLHTFWSNACELIRGEIEPLSNSSSNAGTRSSSNFLRTIFVNEYPRLHLLFERGVYERVSKWSRVNGASMIASSVSGGAGGANGGVIGATDLPMIGAEERHTLLTAFLPFFQLYLARTFTVLSEPINLMFTSHQQQNALPTVPSKNDIHAFLQVLHSILDSLGARSYDTTTASTTTHANGTSSATTTHASDDEVSTNVWKSISKSLAMLATHVERMMVVPTESGGDRDIFASSLLQLADGSASGASIRPSSQSLSQSQRTNLDLFAILCQVEKDLFVSEIHRKHPGVLNTKASIASVTKILQALRKLQEQFLHVLLQSVTNGLTSCFYTLVPEDDLQALQSHVDGSLGMQQFRRRWNYCQQVLFPAYMYHIQGGAQSNTHPLHPDDAQSRMTLWIEKLLRPLHQHLTTTFVHILSLRPLSSSSSPAILNDTLRSNILTDLTLFDSYMQVLKRVMPQSRRGNLASTAGASTSTVTEFETLLPSFKSALFARDISELALLYANRSLDHVTLLNFLFTTLAITNTNNPTATPITHTAPHRLLHMKVEEYSKFIESHNLMEIIELFNKGESKNEATYESKLCTMHIIHL